MSRFEEGVDAALDLWDVLNMAIDSGWGGSEQECIDKKLDMKYDIMYLFTEKKFSVFHLEDHLRELMSEDFCINVEDGSIEWTSKLLIRLHEDCERGDFAGLEKLLQRRELKRSKAERAAMARVTDEIGEMDIDNRSEGEPELEHIEEEEGWTTVRK